LAFSIDLLRRPYNTVALPCECVIVTLKFWSEVTQVIETVPFESLGAVSYSPSVVTMALFCVVCEIERLTGRKSRNFYTPSVFIDSVGISRRCLILIELCGEDNMLSRFDRIAERDGRNDRQTDRQT